MNSAAMRRMFALANAFKEGDLLVGGTRDDLVRADARRDLAAVTIGDIRRAVFVDDGVSATLEQGRDRSHDGALDPLTVGQIRTILLDRDGPEWARVHRRALPSEATAAVVKVMSDDELASVSARLFNPLRDGVGGSDGVGGNGRPSADGRRVTIGAANHFGSRLQPNSPGDQEEEILFSILDGLTYGCGDVIIGLNPAADDVDTIIRLEQLLESIVRRLDLPTRYCVLSDIVKQQQARQATRVDVGFQSLAGTSSALFGMVGLDADGILDLARSFEGLYFETGQGSAVTSGTAHDVDMVTLEARAYGVARHIQHETGAWTIVNDVAGFIGPEVFRTSEQLARACLEDLVMAKLHGLTMGLDVCATFHMGIPPAELRTVTERIVERGAPAYLMAVAGNADPMLGYLTTATRDHPRLRERSGRQATSVMQSRLKTLATETASLYAIYAKAAGEQRSVAAVAIEGTRKLEELRERGFDLGGNGSADARLDRIYQHARRALYARVEDTVIRDVCPRPVTVSTEATDREDYLAHPRAGERIRPRDADAIRALYPTGRPQVQIVVSDGLNANAINEQARALLPAVKRLLHDTGCDVGAYDVIVRNGRVRAGYHVGALTDAAIIVHVIGERPGTGLNTASAYLTYGRDEAGRGRWDPQMDHSCTTAVCGIHPRGKQPDVAAAEITRTVARMLEQRRSGVTLR